MLSNNIAKSSIYGIRIDSSESNTLTNNKMLGNKYNFGFYGYWPSDFIQDIDESNTVDGKPIYYWVNKQNQEIPNDAGYVGIINSTNITAVKDLNLKNNG